MRMITLYYNTNFCKIPEVKASVCKFFYVETSNFRLVHLTVAQIGAKIKAPKDVREKENRY